jgi:response regulator RpfG family c-di-GMP phosphodiesterase
MRMPEMDGTQFLEQVREHWPDTVRLLLTGQSDVSSIIDVINRGEIYRYISKPWDDNDIFLIVQQALERKALEHEKRRLEELTHQQNEAFKALNASLEAKVEARTTELKEVNDKLKSSFVTSIKVFSALIEMRGGNLAGHSRRVAEHSRKIANKLKLENKQVQEIFIASLLHEIGKVGFSDELLNTPLAAMKPEQVEDYRKHTLQAGHLLLPLPDLRVASDIICAQFERFDGTGFPDKLAGEAIPLGSRILCLASDFDNMQIGTMTKRKLTADEAKILINHGSGKRYDPHVVEAFLDLIDGPAREEAERERKRERQILARELEVDMVLSRDILTPSGVLILSAEYTLDVHLIRKIIDFERSTGLQLTAYIHAEKTP